MKKKLMKKIMISTIITITTMNMLSIGASASWKKDGHGWWNSKGNNYSVGWENIGNKWFYFNTDGYMKTGWLKDGDKWYYLNSNGDMMTGWVQDAGKWYYLNQNGDMAYNIIIDGYNLGSDGAWIDINVNVTTGAAVNITTGSAVNITINEENDENDSGSYLDKLSKKVNQQVQKIEQKVNKAWKHFYK